MAGEKIGIYEYRFTRHKVGEIVQTLRYSRDSYEAVKPFLTSIENEKFAVVALDTAHHIIGVTIVYEGNVNSTIVRIAEILKFPIRLNAPSIVIAHNHPSQSSTPSPNDLHLTAEVLGACRLMDIRLLDHIVVTDSEYISMRDRGVSFD